MHLIVPFAGALSEAGRAAAQDLAVPQLERLLARLVPVQADRGDERSLSPPHERALARELGWSGGDGTLPWAAQVAATAGIATGNKAWALLTPVHLDVGADQVTLVDPAELALDAADSRALFERVRTLFDGEGFALHWAAPLQWLAAHELFAGLATASIDRAIGRNIDPWLPDQRAARLLRRLQSEVQMLLHTEPLNEARQARGQHAVNSFWASGCGTAQITVTSAAVAREAPIVDAHLRRPALAADWVAWREAWAALDADAIATLARHEGPVALTLCGERSAQRFESRPGLTWRRLAGAWRRPSIAAVLEAL